MNKQILADYYEEKYLIKKAQRLRKRNAVILFGTRYAYGAGYFETFYHAFMLYNNRHNKKFGCGYGYGNHKCNYSNGEDYCYRSLAHGHGVSSGINGHRSSRGDAIYYGYLEYLS